MPSLRYPARRASRLGCDDAKQELNRSEQACGWIEDRRIDAVAGYLPGNMSPFYGDADTLLLRRASIRVGSPV
jgi:hypothetical protein